VLGASCVPDCFALDSCSLTQVKQMGMPLEYNDVGSPHVEHLAIAFLLSSAVDRANDTPAGVVAQGAANKRSKASFALMTPALVPVRRRYLVMRRDC
jgi:hypothetical protein